MGDRSQAVHYLDQLDAVAMEADLTIAHFRRHHARARLLGDVDAARTAHQLIATTPLRFHRAVAQLTLAEVDDSSSPYLIEAHQTFDELNALPWRQRAAAALRQAGMTVPRSPEEHGGLSETERCLARLVADGLTNREIAVTMHYSVKTVEVYLTRLYAKTECRSRLELARAVDRGDITVERTF
jgi:DNA-binding CsgD family transcriptional regulator